MANTATSIVEEYKEKLHSRLEELKPIIEEYNEIERALGSMEPGATVRGRRTSSRAHRGQRYAEFLEAVGRHQEGVTVADAVRGIDIAATYGYKLAEQGEKEGRIEKRGNLLFLVPEGEKPSGVKMPDAPSGNGGK